MGTQLTGASEIWVHSYINHKILGGHVPVCPPYEYGPVYHSFSKFIKAYSVQSQQYYYLSTNLSILPSSLFIYRIRSSQGVFSPVFHTTAGDITNQPQPSPKPTTTTKTDFPEFSLKMLKNSSSP